MTSATTKVLDSGDILPTLSMETVAHGRLIVPVHFRQGWGFFLLYRAPWSPYCKQQLAAFERAQDKLWQEGISVVAASTDPIEKAKETVSEHSLTFPVRYGLPLQRVAATFGAFYEERRGFLQATGFVIKPDMTPAFSQYSSGPIGRLVWQDVLGLVQFHKKQAK